MAVKKKRLSGKVALITGAGRGVGRAVAAAYAREGASIIYCARSHDELVDASQEALAAGAEVLVQECDVAEAPQVKALVRQALKKFKKIDILVNNAGILSPRADLVDVRQDHWENVLRVNLTGVFLITREVLKKSIIPNKKGCVINVSSGVGRTGKAKWGPYGVSKFGLEGMTQTLAKEYPEGPIRFYSLNPGPTRSRMRAEAYPEEDPKTLKGPETVAEAFVQLALDDCAVASGSALDCDRATGRLLV